MELEDLKGVKVDEITVKRIVSVKHSLNWETEWIDSTDKPAPDKFRMYDLYELYVWLGY